MPAAEVIPASYPPSLERPAGFVPPSKLTYPKPSATSGNTQVSGEGWVHVPPSIPPSEPASDPPSGPGGKERPVVPLGPPPSAQATSDRASKQIANAFAEATVRSMELLLPQDPHGPS